MRDAPIGDAEHAAFLAAIEAVRAAVALDPAEPRSAALALDAEVRAQRAADALDAAVASGLRDAAVGDEVWTVPTVHAAPLVVAQIIGDQGDTDARACATAWLTADGGLVAQAQHDPEWDDEHDRAIPDGLTPVYYERWTGHGFVMSGTCHPVSRGTLRVEALGAMRFDD